MDILLNADNLKFSIDEIFLNNDNKFTAVIIPEMNSKFYPPYHLRTLRFLPIFLTEKFFHYILATDKNQFENVNNFSGSVVQGGYYEIPTDRLRNLNPFNEQTVIEQDLFAEFKKPSPYKTQKTTKEIVPISELQESFIKKKKNGYMHLYCFNVGQGDTFLLITSNKNVYLVDSNFYSDNSADTFIESTKRILRKHDLDPNVINSIIVTHKHVDHIRGLDYIISSNEFIIDNFFINFDYVHPTKIVQRVINAANQNIKNHFNVNRNGKIIDGDTILSFWNPDSTTNTKTNAPDINDSSICFHATRGSCNIVMTGDTGYSVINRKFGPISTPLKEGILKVSHHGSRTGTDQILLDRLPSSYSFISAGNSIRYQHPHKEITDLLDLSHTILDVKVSKAVKRTIHYEVRKHNIILN